ncbi:hypothetical protein Poli38472_000334 [Pythium oligandrum]|uniref:Uncharacterized protein n=1 Tax=Pythium oligandrum TaxID=41045 RepID=A0A8K1CBR4_PYTOL|nr:hypothetical protein Poli38472_000334 [Pythium oligandrum]|eukprot:TMW60292.1 hypothetical protein Poli38472_000334 [Pythium oligandrum]
MDVLNGAFSAGSLAEAPVSIPPFMPEVQVPSPSPSSLPTPSPKPQPTESIAFLPEETQTFTPVPQPRPAPPSPSSATPSSTPSPLPQTTTPQAPETTSPPSSTPVSSSSSIKCSNDEYQAINRYYQSNKQLQDECTTVTDCYSFPFDSYPTTDQMKSIVQSEACLKLFKGISQVLTRECEVGDMPVLDTAQKMVKYASKVSGAASGELVVRPSDLKIVGNYVALSVVATSLESGAVVTTSANKTVSSPKTSTSTDSPQQSGQKAEKVVKASSSPANTHVRRTQVVLFTCVVLSVLASTL